ncbi:60S ribosomal protein L27 [Aphelenchoides besseyi]|nr:60S ribosomal protein L27 [Aphelenchoides besseyi]KAI6225883.1 60S ribosomal protein L27 [Aphelenchoides besseyi]
MTKRRPKNARPSGSNKSLGNALVNKTEVRRSHTKAGPTIIEHEEGPSKTLASITHENAYTEFFNNADLAGRDFAATREDFKLVNTTEIVNVEDIQSKDFDYLLERWGRCLRIPRRPPRDSYSNAKELEAKETEMFFEWKRDLAKVAEGDGVVLTPFERNLELWRQLWRVLERSDMIVQIVDSRNPLLFRSADLENYANEFNPPKKCVLLVNKADLLSLEQVKIWSNYFKTHSIDAIFWSATSSTEKDDDADEQLSEQLEDVKIESEDTQVPYIKNAEELISTLKQLAGASESSVVVGMVGYPNVGKSSTINRIIGAKKTSVSATPGKTKHFQTLIVDEELTLCDCPGLVMPSFGFSPAEMLLNGILPVDQMHDFFSPVQLLCTRVPRSVFEAMYSVILPKPADFEDPNRPVSAHELLTTMAFMRGFMSAAGIPDSSRAARIVLKDVFHGRMKWIAAPPNFNQREFDKFTVMELPVKDVTKTGETLLQQLNRRNYLIGASTTDRRVDDSFFGANTAAAHIRPVKGRGPVQTVKQHFKGKKEKLRRLHDSSICIMGKIMKQGRVVIMLGGRFAGRKAIVVKPYDDGSNERPYGHALIAGIDKYPRKVTKTMGKKTVARRSTIRPFIRVASYAHLLPTRCVFDLDFDKSIVNKESLKNPAKKRKARTVTKKEFESRYKSGKNKWLFTKLRF